MKFRRLAAEDITLNNETVNNDHSTLYKGMGVHYSFIWVGTPPQRVSVIIDTGSRHTAFPCKGCRCGKHMDPYFDPSISQSAKIAKCSLSSLDSKCYFKQSYSEGSSWHAYKVSDKITMADSNYDSVSNKPVLWSVRFEFGCQDSESGLFRTQNIDGIMGMSAYNDTLPFKLHEYNVTSTKAFSLCMKLGGGYITLGAKIQSNILNNQPTMKYIKLIKSKGWFTIKLIDIFMRGSNNTSNNNNNIISLTKFSSLSISKCNHGKGVIVDSGTTDTYLPSLYHQSFSKLFYSFTNIKYTNNIIELSQLQYNSLPTIIYRFQSIISDEFVDIECPHTSYTEKLSSNYQFNRNNNSKGKYAFRIYLTENHGVVLGSNFMNNYLINFDIDSNRLGMISSDCSNNKSSMLTAITTEEFNDKIKHRPLLPKKQKSKNNI